MSMPPEPSGEAEEPSGQTGPDPVTGPAVSQFQPQSRVSEMATGANGAGGVPPPVSLTPSDQADQLQQNAGPRPYQPTGTNQQIIGSGMGSSQKDQQRMLMGGAGVGSFLKTSNGMSQSTYQQIRPLMNSSISK